MAQGNTDERTLVGMAVGSIVRFGIAYTDEKVNRIDELFPGDHVVLYRWLGHPRCHMIVTGINNSNNKMKVIRFTYQDGVVEGEVAFSGPIYRVIYPRPFEAEEVIRRARDRILPAKAYNILRFNCKHYAFWCVTDAIPLLP